MNPAAPQFAILATPDPVPERVDRSQWPVHVTVAGNFAVDRSAEATTIDLLESSARETAAFEVRLGPSALFGKDADIPVLLAAHPSFDKIHRELAAGLMELPGFAALEPDFWLKGYRAHATLGRAVHVTEGETLPIRVVTLVLLRGATGTRVAAFELG
jgi:2'-5' RNA ligase